MTISMIAAMAENGIIGKDNHMPWRIKSEMKHFIRTTKGKPVIMGRKTFESLSGGKPLDKGRTNIIITRQTDYPAAEDVIVTGSLDEALEAAKKICRETNENEIIIAGGAEIYRQALPLANRIYLTEIHFSPDGDASFPTFDRTEWQDTHREFHTAKEGETADFTLVTWDRK